MTCLREVQINWTPALSTEVTELISAILIQGTPDFTPAYRRYPSASCAINRRLRATPVHICSLWIRISIHSPNDLHLAIKMMALSLRYPLDISVRLFHFTRLQGLWRGRDKFSGSRDAPALRSLPLLVSCPPRRIPPSSLPLKPPRCLVHGRANYQLPPSCLLARASLRVSRHFIFKLDCVELGRGLA